jgi:cysteinyl-tRNA synthetase
VLKLYDTRTGQVEPVPEARRGQLRICLYGPALPQSAHLGELHPYLLADVIRRAAEQHRLLVSAWQDASGPETGLWVGAALNIHPFDPSPQPTPASDLVVDVRPTGDGDGRGGASAFGTQDTAARVVHGQPLLFDGEVMGEAANNVVHVTDLVTRGLDPLAFRLTFLGHQYREPLDLNWPTLEAADAAVRRWRDRVATWATSPSRPMCAPYLTEFTAAVDDDLDTPAALGVLSRLEKDSDISPGSKFETFVHLDQLLGLDLARDIGR